MVKIDVYFDNDDELHLRCEKDKIAEGLAVIDSILEVNCAKLEFVTVNGTVLLNVSDIQASIINQLVN